MSKSFNPQISEFWFINWHKCVTIYKFMEQFFKKTVGVQCPSYGHLSNLLKNELSIYEMKGQQLWCNVNWKFVEDPFTYQKALIENFCDLWFSCKSRNSDCFRDFWLTACSLVKFSKISCLTCCVVLSLFAHFWSHFLTNFDVWQLIWKFRSSSTRIWSNFETRGLKDI